MPEHTGSAMFTCPMCGKSQPCADSHLVQSLSDELTELLALRSPGLSPDALICGDCVDELHSDYFEHRLEEEVGELDNLEQEVLESLEHEDLITDNVNEEFEEKQTIGQRIADKVAEVGGSWSFIIAFSVSLIIWMIINSVMLRAHAFDPYPYILLNLCLSTVAALQAPVIMMSQNRLAAKDRMRAEMDYQVNLKAELQVHHIHDMLDHLMTRQWERLLEIERTQARLIEGLGSALRNGSRNKPALG